MNTRWTDRLSEFLDGELSPDERRQMEAHLAAHPEDARTLEELRRVSRRARALDDRTPPADLWPGIAVRIGASVSPVPETRGRAGSGTGRVWKRRVVLSVPQLVAAGIAAALLGGAGWLFGGGTGEGRAAPAAPSPPSVAAVPAVADVGVRAATFTGTAFDEAIAELYQLFEAERGGLSPETVAVVEASLATIDRALAQAQAALAADPESDYLQRHLERTARQKLMLLRRVATVSSAS